MPRNGRLDDVDTIDLVDEVLKRSDLDEEQKQQAKHEMLTHCGYTAEKAWVKRDDKRNGRRVDDEDYV